ncbi:restriction endonuclease subunit S [Mesorhizobium sp. B2-3-15]|uniref:restriction endonuclease subunit S n=1 Tax=Mesorhizobium sp. B2-3-15 TaxID=2589949 RepID=UPI00112D2814|nr:restriction endonuclease subunit S [Mesorhizobium sp. B2-3-15]TPL75957.1 restriction endonuclease subunit S [Mesorhizobium sp. B2-3-15]
MNVRSVPIGDLTTSVSTWNPVRNPEEPFRYIDLSAVDQDIKSIVSASVIKGRDAPTRARQIVACGDVLVSTVRPNLNGVAPVSKEYDGATASTGFCVLRPNAGKLLSSYLMHWVRTPQFIQSMIREATGASYPAVSDRIVKNSLIPLPSLPEQRRIATILDKADALRRKRKRAIELLDSLTQSIFLEMFGDPTANPKGWEKTKLGDLCDVGSSKRVFASEFAEEGVPFYRGMEVGKLGAGEIIHPDLHISQDHYESIIQESGKPEIGDLLLPSICHDGRIWRVNTSDPFYFKDGRVLWIKRRASEINSEYLRNQLKNIFVNKYQSIASGTTFAELKIVNLKNLWILNPPLHLQNEFSARILGVEKQQSESSHSEKAIAILFSSLQSSAFSGQL